VSQLGLEGEHMQAIGEGPAGVRVGRWHGLRLRGLGSTEHQTMGDSGLAVPPSSVRLLDWNSAVWSTPSCVVHSIIETLANETQTAAQSNPGGRVAFSSGLRA